MKNQELKLTPKEKISEFHADIKPDLGELADVCYQLANTCNDTNKEKIITYLINPILQVNAALIALSQGKYNFTMSSQATQFTTSQVINKFLDLKFPSFFNELNNDQKKIFNKISSIYTDLHSKFIENSIESVTPTPLPKAKDEYIEVKESLPCLYSFQELYEHDRNCTYFKSYGLFSSLTGNLEMHQLLATKKIKTFQDVINYGLTHPNKKTTSILKEHFMPSYQAALDAPDISKLKKNLIDLRILPNDLEDLVINYLKNR